MYKFTKNKLPLTFNNFFVNNQSIRYSLRINSQQKYKLPKNTCKYVEHSVAYRGPKLWNTLFVEIKSATSPNTFKGLLKIHLLNNT